MATPWAVVADLASASDAAFHEIVTPISLMVRLSYTATLGSYYNASEANATVPGWTRVLSHTANPPAGMRALLFVQPETRRAVVAYRGTDLNRTSESGQADACADLLLAGTAPTALPPFCAAFSNATLDYIPRAAEFAAAAAAAYPGFQLLLSGHSLGASLAMMVAAMHAAGPTATPSLVATPLPAAAAAAAAAQTPVVGFATGSWRGALRRRTGLAPNASAAARDQRALFALADRWDPVQASATAASELLGEACLWGAGAADGADGAADWGRAARGEGGASRWVGGSAPPPRVPPRVPPRGCEACWRAGGGHPPPQWEGNAACLACFEQTHVYSHYVNHLVPGARPRCGAAAA